MTTPVGMVDATFYAQVKPTFGRVWQNNQLVDGVTKAAVQTITQTRPKKPGSGVVVCKLTLRFNAASFMPLQPAAIIEIPDNLFQLGQVIEVIAEDLNDAAAVAVAAAAARAARGGTP